MAVGGSVLGAGLNAAMAKPAKPVKRLATDWVPLGNSGVKVTRLAFGTGTFGGKVQRELGQEQFTRLVRYAYDHGIRFFETAQNYAGMPEMLRIALDGIPRDSYWLMTKYRLQQTDDPMTVLDRYPQATQHRILRYPAAALRADRRTGRRRSSRRATPSMKPSRRRSSWRTARRATGWCPSGRSPASPGWMCR